MDKVTKYQFFGWLCVFGSLIINAQLTIAFIISLFVMLIILNFGSNELENDTDREELIEMMKLPKDEIKEEIAFLFMIVAMTIMLAVSIFNILILF